MIENVTERIMESVAVANVEGRLALIQEVQHPEVLRSALVHDTGDHNPGGKVVVRALSGGEFIVGHELMERGFAENKRGKWRVYKLPLTTDANIVLKQSRAGSFMDRMAIPVMQGTGAV